MPDAGGVGCRPHRFAQKYLAKKDFRLFFPQIAAQISYLNKT
ncbi:hypothetical protein FHR76_000779 [Rhizobium sp. RAS22]|nr:MULTISPECIES: hypothetical protein [Rhizobium/Agrobacterium group]MBB2904435.1 hypothetical protein [Rhizobium sp. RAS22]